MPRHHLVDERWCPKSGVIVVDGRSTDTPVWVSADGTLVLPAGKFARTDAKTGSRIRMLRQLWQVCGQGDLGRITGAAESREDSPRGWFVTMDNGSECCVFEGEFEVIPEGEERQSAGAASAARA